MRPLAIGDRVRLSGGYDMEPQWLQGNVSYFATVRRFIPGQNVAAAAVVELDSDITVGDAQGRILVLELRYANAEWSGLNLVNIEVCDFDPEDKPWQHRRQGTWVESHASCERIRSSVAS